MSNGQAKGGIDRILVPDVESKALTIRGFVKVSCDKLNRQLYRDRVCRAAYGGDPYTALTRYGRTIEELGLLCEAATRVLGPKILNSVTQQDLAK